METAVKTHKEERMAQISVKELLEAGVHFGHQTTRWNPKMKPYIFTARNGIHIVDLQQTAEYANEAFKFVADSVALGTKVLFVGTKKQAQDIIQEQAERVGMYYVNHRWLGGMLTNFRTIKQSIDRLNNWNEKKESGELEALPKKEFLTMQRKMDKLEYSLGGIKTMTKAPEIVFIVDPHKEHIAKREANRLGCTVISLTDTNCDPDDIDFIIPGNDDAIRSITRVVSFIADACAEGLERREVVIRKEVEEERSVRSPKARAVEKKPAVKARAFVSRPDEKVTEADTKEVPEVKEKSAEGGSASGGEATETKS